jgi:sugar phosphate isomerase/epimerase
VKYAYFSVGLPESSPEEAVKLLKKYGYHGIEWRVTTDGGDTSKPGFWGGNKTTLQENWTDVQYKQVADLTKQAGLVVPNIGSYAKVFEFDKVRRNMEVAQIFNAPSFRVNISPYNGKRNYNEVFKEDQDSLAKVIDEAKKQKVKPLVEIHMNTPVASASAAVRFLSPFSPEDVGVIHDAGNMVFEGFENFQGGIEMLGKYLAHVHIKNYSWSYKTINGPQYLQWDAVPSPLRTGVVKFKTLIDALRSVGYDGWLSFEDFSKEASQEDKVKDNLEFIKQVEAL